MFICQRQGKYPPPSGETSVLGLEAVGWLLNENFEPVKRCMTIVAGGSYAQYVKVPKSHLIDIPANLTFVQAAAIPEAWMTAY